MCMYITYMHRSDKPNSLFAAYSFIEFIEYIFSRPEIKEGNITFLSNRICQDPLQNVFGAQRQRGATSDNPSVSEFLKNTQALRVVDSFCSAPVRGNCRGAKGSGTANMGIAITQKETNCSQVIYVAHVYTYIYAFI